MANIVAFITAISIFLLPITIGCIAFALFQRVKNQPSMLELFSVRLSLGALVMYFFANIAAFFPQPRTSFSYFSYTVVALIFFAFTASTILNISKLNKKTALIFGYCFTLAILSQLIWKWKSGLSSSLDWDTFLHQTIINNIVQGNFSFLLSQISDSVRIDAYSSIFHTLVAIPYAVFKPQILPLWWLAGFLQLVFISLTSFNLGMAVFDYASKQADVRLSYKVGALTAFFGTFSFLSYLAYNPYFLIPQILSATVTANGLGFLLNKLKSNASYRQIILQLAPVFVFIILNHYILGIYGATLLMTAVVFDFLVKTKPSSAKVALYLLGIASLAAILALNFFNFSNINPGESSFYAADINDKIKQLIGFYGYLIFGLLPLGVVYLIKITSLRSNVILALVLAVLTSTVVPIPYNLKFLAFGSFMFHSVMALGFLSLITNKIFKLPFLLYVGLALAVLINLLNNVITYKQTPSYHDTYTHISPNETAAANYLKTKYKNENAMIVADPASMFVLEALSGLNSPGGAYADQTTRKIIYEMYLSRDATTSKNQILQLADGINGQADVYLLVLSHRYFDWVKSSEEQIFAYYYNIWQPSDLKIEDYSFLEFLKDKAQLPVVYSNPGLVIFEIKR